MSKNKDHETPGQPPHPAPPVPPQQPPQRPPAPQQPSAPPQQPPQPAPPKAPQEQPRPQQQPAQERHEAQESAPRQHEEPQHEAQEPPTEGGGLGPPQRPRAGRRATLTGDADALRQENEALKARLAALEKLQAPHDDGPPGRWRVSLSGVRPRVVDEKGRVQHQDHLDVTARSRADAEEIFRRYNGIISTASVFTTHRLDDEPNAPVQPAQPARPVALMEGG